MFAGKIAVALLAATLPGGSGATAQENCSPIKSDICIIGGGSAGTYAAIGLLDRGKDVVVVEAAAQLGGHTNTYTDAKTGVKVNAGVQAFTNTTVVQKYFERLNVSLLPVPAPSGSTVYADFTTGSLDGNFSLPSPVLLMQAFQRYGALLSTNFSYLANGYDLPSPVPKDLLLPFGQFAKKFGIEDALYLINQQTQPNEIAQETSLYTLKNFDLLVLSAIANPKLAVTASDIGQLYTNAAAALGDKVLFNSTVSKLSRTSSGVTLKVHTADGTREIRANKVLMASPPTLQNLRGWDLTGDEESILAKFRYHGYMAGVFRCSGIPSGTVLSAVGRDTPYNVPRLPGISLIQPTQIPETYVVFFASQSPLPVEATQSLFREQLGRLGRSAGWNVQGLEILAWYDHNPVKAYVEPEEIQNGFYKNLYGLQGKRHTWWTGAAWQSQASPPIWSFTESILDELTQ